MVWFSAFLKSCEFFDMSQIELSARLSINVFETFSNYLAKRLSSFVVML